MSFAALAERMTNRGVKPGPSMIGNDSTTPAWLLADPLAVRLLMAGFPTEVVVELTERVAVTRGGHRVEPIADLLVAAKVAGCRIRWLGGWYELDADPTPTAQAFAELVRQDHAEVAEYLRAGALRRFAALVRHSELCGGK